MFAQDRIPRVCCCFCFFLCFYCCCFVFCYFCCCFCVFAVVCLFLFCCVCLVCEFVRVCVCVLFWFCWCCFVCFCFLFLVSLESIDGMFSYNNVRYFVYARKTTVSILVHFTTNKIMSVLFYCLNV